MATLQSPASLSRIDIWKLAIRPKTLPAAITPIVVGLAFAVREGEGSLPIAIVTIAVSLLLQIAANFANDLSDFYRGADVKRMGPPRVTQLGLLSSSEVKRGIGVVLGLATLLGGVLIARGGWPIALLGVASILAALAYTGGPFPLGYHGLGEVAVALFFGGVGVLGTVYLQLDRLPGASYAAAIAVAALASAILVVNNLRDLDTDREAGKHTLAVRFGERGTLLEYNLLLITPFVIPIVMTALDWRHVGWIATWVVIPKAYSVAKQVAVVRGPGLNPLLGATAKLGLWYSIVLAGGIVLERWL